MTSDYILCRSATWYADQEFGAVEESARRCINLGAAPGESLAFLLWRQENPQQPQHGYFNSSGIFTVRTPGNYQFIFKGHVKLTSDHLSHQFDLKLNGKTVASSLTHSTVEVTTNAVQLVDLTAFLSLKTGDEVGIFVNHGQIYEGENYRTKFHGIYIQNYYKYMNYFVLGLIAIVILIGGYNKQKQIEMWYLSWFNWLGFCTDVHDSIIISIFYKDFCLRRIDSFSMTLDNT